MNFYIALIFGDTVVCLLLCLACIWLDKKCWDLLGVVKGMNEVIKYMSKHIAELEEKIGLVHSDIQE